MATSPEDFMRRAIALSRQGLERGQGGPFGAVVARAGQILGEGRNRVLVDSDPTAHAEIVAIRAAAQQLGDFSLAGAELYTSCEPCPMCLTAAWWARVDRIVYANTRQDAAAIGFDDAFFYEQLPLAPDARAVPMVQLLRSEAQGAFAHWASMPDKTMY